MQKLSGTGKIRYRRETHMDTEMKISILMQDGCTRKEAEMYLERGTEIYKESDVQDYIDSLKANGRYDGETVEYLLAGEHAPDGTNPVEFAGKNYLIVYVN